MRFIKTNKVRKSRRGKPGTVPEYQVRTQSNYLLRVSDIICIYMIPGTCVCGDCTHCWCWTPRVERSYELNPAQQTQQGPQHRESYESPWIMSTSKGRASKRAKIVDNEPMDEDSSNGVGRVICIYFVQVSSRKVSIGTYEVYTWCVVFFSLFT